MENRPRTPRSPLTTERRIEIASHLQVLTLDMVARAAEYRRDLVFHGGTAIAAVHGSPRWSEDLDFMAAPGAIEDVFSQGDRIVQDLRATSEGLWPGATVDMQFKARSGLTIGDVEKFTIRWEHPDIVGVIKIKVEFYACPEDQLYSYGSHLSRYALNGRIGSEIIRAASVHSAWADKIVALAQRPVLKFRDIHDLGFLSRKFGRCLDNKDGSLLLALHASTGIYSRTTEQIARGLVRPAILKAMQDVEAFKADMKRWFPSDIFRTMESRGVLDIYHHRFLQHATLARELIAEDMTLKSTFRTLSC